MSCLIRKKSPNLRSIKDDNGHMVNGETSIKAAAVYHFQNILGQIRSCNVNSNFKFERVRSVARINSTGHGG